MAKRRRKGPREKDLTSRYFGGDFDPDRVDASERFSDRSKHSEQTKIERTAAMRAEGSTGQALDRLPIGEVIQVYSLFADVEAADAIYLCVVRKTLSRVSDTAIVVGDRVRFTPTGTFDDSGRPEGVVEQLLQRETILARADSFKGLQSHPIVANARQMLIVVAVAHPRIKWGLIDRMLIAAKAGGLEPIICLNKIDLAQSDPKGQKQFVQACEALDHYATMGIRSIHVSATQGIGLDELRDCLTDQSTVLAGHSGVGKSSLLGALQPGLVIRVGEVSQYTEKGRHTTTSAKRYKLDFGGEVIDTPGVKQFALWSVTADNLGEFFPDISDGTAPKWRLDSHERIAESLR
jgi:ribosome biogenesis GTPase